MSPGISSARKPSTTAVQAKLHEQSAVGGIVVIVPMVLTLLDMVAFCCAVSARSSVASRMFQEKERCVAFGCWFVQCFRFTTTIHYEQLFTCSGVYRSQYVVMRLDMSAMSLRWASIDIDSGRDSLGGVEAPRIDAQGAVTTASMCHSFCESPKTSKLAGTGSDFGCKSRPFPTRARGI